ncbi:MAG: hypothetical protein KDE53_31865, partial [Caldilineaceae bacterium]|nr:hypothetical protein [Caldilineaceae bacterium]
MAGELITAGGQTGSGSMSRSGLFSSATVQRHLGRALLYLIAIGGSALFMFPFVWTVLSSLKKGSELFLFPPTWFPAVPQPQNYPKVFEIVPWGLWTWNSV